MANNMKMYSISLAIKEIQIKTTMKYHYMVIRIAKINSCDINVGRDEGKQYDSYITDGNLKCYSHSGKQFRTFL